MYRDMRLRALLDSPDAFGSTYAAEAAMTDDRWTARIDAATSSGRDCALFAVHGENVCGLVWCNLPVSEPGTANVYQMWVDPAARGLGAGHALLDAVVGWARKMGARRVCLGVTDGDSPAMRLYKKHGFRQVGQAEPLREGSQVMMRKLELTLCSV